MSEIKALEKLREYVDKQREEYNNHNVSFVWQLGTIANEIEAEIVDRYMLQPVDADGVRIDLGDKLIEHDNGHEFIVDGVKIWGSTYEWWVYEDCGVLAPAMRCTHVMPRTLENVIEGAINAAFGNEAPISAITKKTADEIRNLLLDFLSSFHFLFHAHVIIFRKLL